MDYSGFCDWLIKSKGMSVRSARDVISRCKRICSFLSVEQIENLSVQDLNENETFMKQSMFVKSQLRRAISLWNEYGGANE